MRMKYVILVKVSVVIHQLRAVMMIMQKVVKEFHIFLEVIKID